MIQLLYYEDLQLEEAAKIIDDLSDPIIPVVDEITLDLDKGLYSSSANTMATTTTSLPTVNNHFTIITNGTNNNNNNSNNNNKNNNNIHRKDSDERPSSDELEEIFVEGKIHYI